MEKSPFFTQMQVLQQQQAHAANAVPLYQTPAAPVQQAADLDITELETLLCKIMESCTKESISVSCSAAFPRIKIIKILLRRSSEFWELSILH